MSSVVCPVDLDTRRLQAEIAAIYARVATDPSGEFHFHRGPAYAAELLGYDPLELAALPSAATESFAGISNPLAIAPLRAGDVVVDLGSGAGTDLLLAARRVGPGGKAIGVDRTPEMIAKCRGSAAAAGLENVEIREGDVHALPIEDASADVVISNGVLNLAHDKPTAFREIVRILKPGGRLQLGDIAVESELSEKVRSNYELWAAWIGGALPEAELVEVLGQVGLVDVHVVQRFDCFKGTSKESVARKFGVRGVNISALKAK